MLDAYVDPEHARKDRATELGSAAYARLLKTAENGNSGQTSRLVRFLAGVYNGGAFPFDLYDLRTFDLEISDDMLLVLDMLRWAKIDPHSTVDRGGRRVEALIDRWGLQWPTS